MKNFASLLLECKKFGGWSFKSTKDDFLAQPRKKISKKDIVNYSCILYLKFLWYHRNKMLWDRFNQQNYENKILGWKEILSKQFV